MPMPRLTLRTIRRFCALLALLHAAPVSAQLYRPVLTPTPGDTWVDVQVERHPNGLLARRVFRLNGKPHGLWQEWDSAGRLTYLADWRNGEGEGAWTYFHPNGLVRERSWVTGDVWHGPSEGWHANGQKALEGTFVRGAKDGPFRYWREDGTPFGPAAELFAPSPTPVPVLTEGWPAGFQLWDVTLTRDLEVMFVGTGDAEGNQRRIMMRRWAQNRWQPVELAPFADTSAAEGSPMVSADGEWVYFSSARHAASEPANPRREIYRASRASGWKRVERVTRTPRYGEVSLTLSRNGTGVLWSGSPDGAPRTGLYEVRLDSSTTAPTPRLTIVADLTSLHRDDASGESFPVLAPDGSFLVFSNYDVGGKGTKEDIFITRRATSGWSQPIRLMPGANSAGDEMAAQLVDDGRTLLFRSSRSAETRLYRVSLDAVVPPRPER
jgi:WD40-like Beta Propeller Repeat